MFRALLNWCAAGYKRLAPEWMVDTLVSVGVGIEEATMATMVSIRRSTFGINCVRCKDELIAPERSEYRHGTQIRNLWYCSNCDTSFESIEV
jgi:hypothetical protein